jgi:hypothetical protein
MILERERELWGKDGGVGEIVKSSVVVKGDAFFKFDLLTGTTLLPLWQLGVEQSKEICIRYISWTRKIQGNWHQVFRNSFEILWVYL